MPDLQYLETFRVESMCALVFDSDDGPIVRLGEEHIHPRPAGPNEGFEWSIGIGDFTPAELSDPDFVSTHLLVRGSYALPAQRAQSLSSVIDASLTYLEGVRG